MSTQDNDIQVKSRHSRWLWLLLALLFCAGIYAVISYWIPYSQWRAFKGMIYTPCAAGDRECVDETLALWKKSLEVQAPIFRVLKSTELAEALKHPDGTACFLITDTSREASGDEMKAWLDNFGAERFYDMMPFFMRLRGSFEKKYHPPDPLKVRSDVVASLKWRHIPFGSKWRDYNFAQRFWNWSLEDTPEEPQVSEDVRKEVFSQYAENGYLFQDQNILRLFDTAKSEIEGGEAATR